MPAGGGEGGKEEHAWMDGWIGQSRKSKEGEG